jgi:hypothetical protein
MVITKKGYSALEMQRLLGHKRYEPIWLMMHKLRIIMGNRDANYLLDGFVEFDDAFFAGHRAAPNELTGKPAKEIARNSKVLIAVNGNDKNAKYLKMTVVETFKTDEINYEVPKMLCKSAEVISDGRRSYKGIKQHVQKHTVHIIKNKKTVCKTFPWVHTAIGNAKRKINGLHHHVKNNYMQNYLSEFVYKFNRRHFGPSIFDRLIVAVIANSWFCSV